MARAVKVDFYQTVDGDGNVLDVSDQIRRAAALPFAARRVDSADSFICLHDVRDNGRGIFGEVLKAKMSDLPDKISRNVGVPEDLGLRADEGIGHRAHFFYQAASRVLLFQRQRDVRAGSFVSGVAVPLDSVFTLSLIFKQDALNRLNRMRVIRKIAFTIATPAGVYAAAGLDPSAARAIQLLGEMGGRQLQVNVSVGKSRSAGLHRDGAVRLIRSLFGRRGEEVQKVLISGRETPDGAVEVIDMFEDRLVYEEQFPDEQRRLGREALERALNNAYQEHADYLHAYGNP